MQKLCYGRHKYLEFQKYVVCYSFDRASGTDRDEGTVKCSHQVFAWYDTKIVPLKYVPYMHHYNPLLIITRSQL